MEKSQNIGTKSAFTHSYYFIINVVSLFIMTKLERGEKNLLSGI